MSDLWTEKFAPKTLEEFVGNSELVKEVQLWALEWNKKKTGKPLLFFGPVGSGKTELAQLIAKLNDWDLFELNTSDFRTKDVIERLAGAALQNASFSGKLRLVLLDEVDGVQGREDKGGMAAILQVLKDAKNPVILTANDIYANKQMATIRNFCKKLEFKKINYLSVAKRLKQICDDQKIEYDVTSINELAKESNGDLRAALLDLQALSVAKKAIMLDDVKQLGFREREEKIFSVLMKLFRAKTVKEIQTIRNASEADHDMLFRWMEENIPLQFKDPIAMAKAWERLSKADVFNGRITRRQYWGFLRYSSELMTAGVAFQQPEEAPHEFVMYRFPSLLSKLSASSADRALKKGIAEKMQKELHASQREIISYDLPFLAASFENKEKAVSYSALFGFDEKEIAFLLGSTSETKKVQTVLDASKQLREKRSVSRRKPLAPLSEQELEKVEKANEEVKSERSSTIDQKGQLKLF